MVNWTRIDWSGQELGRIKWRVDNEGVYEYPESEAEELLTANGVAVITDEEPVKVYNDNSTQVLAYSTVDGRCLVEVNTGDEIIFILRDEFPTIQ